MNFKKLLLLSFLVVLPIFTVNASTVSDSVKGQILLQVESKGQAWYVDPATKTRAFLGRPEDAFRIMRELGLGITNNDLEKIAVNGSNDINLSFAKKLSGKILLQVEENGEAWYVYPKDNKRYFLGRPADAFRVMRELGLGISDQNLISIEINSKYPEKYYSQDNKLFYSVIRVVDGDTVVVKIDNEDKTLRLIGLDTPESVHPSKPVECFAIQASNKAKDLLENKQVSLEADESQGNIDKYDRLLRYVYLEDGTNFNKLMIEQGYGHEYTYDKPYKYQAEFKEAELNAQKNKSGLWADGVCDNQINDTSDNIIEPLGDCDCSGNIYNCSDFKTHSEAQAIFDCCGGINNDIHKLDADGNGDACETLP